MVPIQHIADDTGHDRDDKRPPISASSLPRTYASAVTRSSTAQEASCIVPASTPKTDKDVPLDLGLYLTLSDLNAHAGPSSPRSPATPPPVSPGVSRKGKGRALDSVTEEDGPPAEVEIFYRPFRSEQEDMEDIMRLVQAELSEPYNIYTFRYFLLDWPHLAYLAYPSPESGEAIGVILCKQDSHRGRTNRGYIAMLSIDPAWRRRGIASRLVSLAIDAMKANGAHEVVLETEYDNASSLALYERLGFFREKRLTRFYSNGKDAFRLVLPFPGHPYLLEETGEEAELGREMVGMGPEELYDTYRYADDARPLPQLHNDTSDDPGRADTFPDVGRLRLDDWWDDGRPHGSPWSGAASGDTGRTDGWPVHAPPPPPIPPRQLPYYT